MPFRSPLGLGFALAALVLAQSGVRAEPSAGTWTDPPPKPGAPAAVSPPRAEPARAGGPATEAVAAKASAKASAKSSAKVSAKPDAKLDAKLAGAPARAEIAARKPARTARAAPSRRAVAARPVVRPERSARRAVVRPVRVARPYDRDWPPAEPAAQPDYPMPRAYDARDPRLERLWSAEEAGYLAVRGRHVAYPDGRVLRIYRPRGDDEDLD